MVIAKPISDKNGFHEHSPQGKNLYLNDRIETTVKYTGSFNPLVINVGSTDIFNLLK